MPEKTNGKTQRFLGKAIRQNDSPTAEDSSIAKAARVLPDSVEAEKAFSFLRERLFHIGRWNEYSEISSFALFDKNGNSQQDKLAVVSDFIKITLPGSGKDDWVKIIEIDESPDEIVLTIQPSRDPTNEENKEATSHFFAAGSTNNFCLRRKDAKVEFYVIGLDEKTNTEETSGILETIRNVATANVGSFLGIQKTQWEIFCRNFLSGEK